MICSYPVQKQKHSQDQAGLWWDVAWEATVAVGVVAGDGQGGLFTESHATIDVEDALIPACNAMSIDDSGGDQA